MTLALEKRLLDLIENTPEQILGSSKAQSLTPAVESAILMYINPIATILSKPIQQVTFEDLNRLSQTDWIEIGASWMCMTNFRDSHVFLGEYHLCQISILEDLFRSSVTLILLENHLLLRRVVAVTSSLFGAYYHGSSTRMQLALF